MNDKPSEDIRSAKDLAEFIRSMHTSLLTHPEQWESRTLPDFLEALAAVVEDHDGGRRNWGAPPASVETWSTLAGILRTASIYE
jgi:hypothetical protein